jgi:hypothetical protein
MAQEVRKRKATEEGVSAYEIIGIRVQISSD